MRASGFQRQHDVHLTSQAAGSARRPPAAPASRPHESGSDRVRRATLVRMEALVQFFDTKQWRSLRLGDEPVVIGGRHAAIKVPGATVSRMHARGTGTLRQPIHGGLDARRAGS